MATINDKLRYAFSPSLGGKAGTLYSWYPNEATSDFTVVRPNEADRINSEGETETMGVNVPLLDYSNGGCARLKTTATDVISGAGDSSTFEQTNGVMYFEILASSDANARYVWKFQDDANNRIDLGFNTSNKLFIEVFSGGTSDGSIVFDENIKVSNKVGFEYANNDIVMWANGIEIGSLSQLIPNAFNEIGMDSFVGFTSSILNYEALTTDELITLFGYTSYSQMVQKDNLVYL